jgi:hypothetical protein
MTTIRSGTRNRRRSKRSPFSTKDLNQAAVVRRFFRQYGRRFINSPRRRVEFLLEMLNRLIDATDGQITVDAQKWTGEYEMSGYTKLTDCNSLTINWQGDQGGIAACLTLQAGGDPLGTPTTSNHVSLANRYSVAQSFRWDSVQVWKRDAGTTGAKSFEKVFEAATALMNQGAPVVLLDPLLAAPQSFTNPAPIPYGLLPYLRPSPLAVSTTERSLSLEPSRLG